MSAQALVLPDLKILWIRPWYRSGSRRYVYEITLPFSLASSCPLTADKKLWGLPYEDLAPKALMKTSFQRTFDSKSSQG